MAANSYYFGNQSYTDETQETPGKTYPPSQTHTDTAYNPTYETPIQQAQPLFQNPKPPTDTSASKPAYHKLNVTDDSPTHRLRQQKYQKWKRYLRAIQLLTKSITIIFSTIMFGIMILITTKFYSTKDIFRGGRTAWPKEPKLWPTFMLLAASAVTLLLSLVTLLAYCFNFGRARRSWKLTVVKYAIHIGAWIVVSVIYRYEKSLHGVQNDLWGWTCSQEVALLQGEFNGVVDFGALCSVQVVFLPPYDHKRDES